MSRATERIEEHPGMQSSYGLLVAVALVVAFLTFIAFLNVVKQGNLLNESNLLYLSLIFYGGASALYIGFGVTGVDRYVKFASIATTIGFAANTFAAGHRWYAAGHPPFANIYEMLLSFVWTIAALTLVAERKYKVKVIGTVTMPLAVTGVILMQLLPSAVRPLVPALQSTWLHVHVTLAMLAYAACALSFALAMMFLIKDQMKTETFLAVTSGMVTAIYLGIMTRFEKWGGLAVAAWDAQNKEEISIQRGVKLMVTIPDLGWVFLLVLLASAAPLAIYAIAKWRKQENFLTVANRALFISIALQVIALAGFLLRARNGAYASPDAEGQLFPTALAASPFILSGLVTGIFASFLYLMLHWRREDLERLLPSADGLDSITYKTIGIAFPLLTAMIAAGAYWANRTWGSYWSWDPKETWAAITWLVYAGYLHMRITRGWRGRRAAYFAILGFAVVMFTFFGVTYLLPGLHAYA
ncbi:MAG TPA: c-type cytochrome biogenesis protein CcsB [Terriglobales bacterium]|jgi:cytochrome c-type biogenesis protein CcsB|nr:c-type cytochrome biogenesis protein CcsB [Terriglobales bacterium]